jgi:hypothetical protein
MRHIIRALTSIVSICAVSGNASAEKYTVGPGRVYQSLQDVTARLVPGDVVELAGGVKYPGGVVLDRAGTRDKPITIRGVRVNGKRPVLSGGTNTLEARADHYVIEGVELTQGAARCFFHHADDVILRDTEIHDCPKQGVLGADNDSGSLLMEFVEVHHCGSGTQAHQIYMATDESAHPGSVFRMQHCYVHDGNGGNNIKSRAERNEIYCNWVEGAMYHELELIGPAEEFAKSGVREDSDVVGNVLVKHAPSFVTRFGGDGTGETRGRYRFVNNTVITQAEGSAVFRLFDGIESLEAYNNLFFAVGNGTVNLIRESEANWAHGRQIAGSNNWVGSKAMNLPKEWSKTKTGSTPGVEAIDNWQLRPTQASPLVDGGTKSTVRTWKYGIGKPQFLPSCVPPNRTLAGAAIARPSDGKIDIGAFEFGATKNVPPH